MTPPEPHGSEPPGDAPQDGASPERLPRARRLARASDIRRCLARGRRRRSEHLEMIWADNSVGHPRMGLIVPKFRHSAVARNRLRRRLRELWRREVQPVQPAGDLLIRARREAYAASFPALRAEVLAWRDGAMPRSRPRAR
ncbi:MAG TPA: ribonuclease P protein component [Gemmatimonadales bacterium]|nr:ribonuclease P protein component [Gemmatimonadales bacterium]